MNSCEPLITSNTNMEAVFFERVVESLECPVCRCIYVQPQILKTCLHSACKKCFDLLAVGTNKLTCPECRAVTPCMERYHDFKTQHLVDVYRELKLYRRQMCTLCERVSAVYLCKACKLLLCQGCKVVHTESMHRAEPGAGHGAEPGEDHGAEPRAEHGAQPGAEPGEEHGAEHRANTAQGAVQIGGNETTVNNTSGGTTRVTADVTSGDFTSDFTSRDQQATEVKSTQTQNTWIQSTQMQNTKSRKTWDTCMQNAKTQMQDTQIQKTQMQDTQDQTIQKIPVWMKELDEKKIQLVKKRIQVYESEKEIRGQVNAQLEKCKLQLFDAQARTLDIVERWTSFQLRNLAKIRMGYFRSLETSADKYFQATDNLIEEVTSLDLSPEQRREHLFLALRIEELLELNQDEMWTLPELEMKNIERPYDFNCSRLPYVYLDVNFEAPQYEKNFRKVNLIIDRLCSDREPVVKKDPKKKDKTNCPSSRVTPGLLYRSISRVAYRPTHGSRPVTRRGNPSRTS